MSIAIVGAGALGRLVANILRVNQQDVIGFYDDDGAKIGMTVNGLVVQGSLADLYTLSSRPKLIIGIGDVGTRQRLYEQFKADGFAFARAVHPSAVIASSAEIGGGVIVKENAVIEVSSKIGGNSIIGNGAIICHDCHIGMHCRIAPAVTIAGHVTIGECCYLGVRVSIDRRLTVGANSVVASGCTLWKPVPPNSIVKLPHPMKIEER